MSETPPKFSKRVNIVEVVEPSKSSVNFREDVTFYNSQRSDFQTILADHLPKEFGRFKFKAEYLEVSRTNPKIVYVTYDFLYGALGKRVCVRVDNHRLQSRIEVRYLVNSTMMGVKTRLLFDAPSKFVGHNKTLAEIAGEVSFEAIKKSHKKAGS